MIIVTFLQVFGGLAVFLLGIDMLKGCELIGGSGPL